MSEIMVNVRGSITDLKSSLAQAKGMIQNFGSITPGGGGGGGGGGFGGGFGFNPQMFQQLIIAIQNLQVNFIQVNQAAQDFDKELQNKPKDAQKAASAFQVIVGALQKANNAIGAAGKRLAWFGFRMTMIGRMFSRNLTKSVSKAISMFTNWDKTITSIATGMAFLAAQGMLTGKAQEMMMGAMQELPAVGMQTEGIMQALSALWTRIGAVILPILGDALLDLIVTIWEVFDANKAGIIETMERIATETIPRLIEIIKEVGPTVITSFVEGFNQGLSALAGFLEAAAPFLPWIAETSGRLMGLGPIISAFGLGLFGVSVIAQTFSTVFGGILAPLKMYADVLANGVSPANKILLQMLPAVGAALGVVIVLVATVVAWWDELSATFNTYVMPAFRELGTQLGRLGEALGIGGNMMGLLKAATTPVYIALQLVMGVVTALTRGIAFLVEIIADSVFGFREMWKQIKKVLDIFGVGGKAADDFAQTESNLYDQLDQHYGHSIGDTMAQQYTVAREALESLLEAQHTPNVIPQTIPINVEMNIDSISSDVDVGRITDEVSRKIADGIVGVFR